MASRGRRPIRPQGGFGAAPEPKSGVPASMIKSARQSGQLNLSGRSLTSVPDTVWRINIDVPEEGKTVSMDGGDDRWWEQTDLTKLILASNWLTGVSEDISNLPALTVLDVHDNRLESLPQALGKVPLCITRLQNLRSLQLEHNQLASLPQEIGALMFLEQLDISNNQLTTVPVSIGHLSHVMRLNISNNKIASLPPEIGCMNGLRELDATHNELSGLPQEVGTLIHLERLYLRHNRLTYLPVLTDCSNLKELHVGNNQISAITAEHISHLPAISILDLRDNKLSSLPDEIVQLQSLERLDVTNNDLAGLPNVLGTVTTLKSIVVDGNPMKTIRRDIVMRGTQEIKKYLRSRIEEPVNIPEGTRNGVQSSEGQSGVIGAGGQGVDAHEVCQMKNLDFSNKKCSKIPEEVIKLAVKGEVTSVNLSKNSFTQLPEGLMLISDFLKELNLGFNKLTSLHTDIGLYFKLTTLDLRNNMLSDLPSDMASLKGLREIYLSFNRSLQLMGNAFRIPRPQILAKGTLALLEHLRGRIAE
ncbi:LRC40-like protein [Mya arenaria]|uniref:LRC40-like protein n=1 Tax=Mya arenaria TaxID=6604 RepID=A0ABY7FPN4_MYAAR|nr:LRC40-like protein [Mya arenaria]